MGRGVTGGVPHGLARPGAGAWGRLSAGVSHVPEFEIGKVFHLTHVVEDLDAVDRWYDEVFGCERFYKAVARLAAREASLLVIGDMVMEPVQVAHGIEGADQQPIGRFLARFGPRFHSIAWYVDDLGATVQSLAAAGVRQVDVTGRRIDPARAAAWKDTSVHAVWTHPKDTHALLEFSEPGFAADPRLAEGWSAARWRDEHPLGIEGTSHLTVLFEDVGDAGAVYEGMLGGRLVREEATDERRSRYFAVGEGIVEARQPLDAGSRAAADLEQAGEGVFAITFKTADVDRAAEFLRGKGQVFERQADGDLVLHPEHAFGMTIAFTERSIA